MLMMKMMRGPLRGLMGRAALTAAAAIVDANGHICMVAVTIAVASMRVAALKLLFLGGGSASVCSSSGGS